MNSVNSTKSPGETRVFGNNKRFQEKKEIINKIISKISIADKKTANDFITNAFKRIYEAIYSSNDRSNVYIITPGELEDEINFNDLVEVETYWCCFNCLNADGVYIITILVVYHSLEEILSELKTREITNKDLRQLIQTVLRTNFDLHDKNTSYKQGNKLISLVIDSAYFKNIYITFNRERSKIEIDILGVGKFYLCSSSMGMHSPNFERIV